MPDDCEQEVDEVLPLERTVSGDTLGALTAMSWTGLARLAGQVQDHWYDLWVGDEDPQPGGERVIRETEARLARFADGGHFFDLKGRGGAFQSAARQLDPVWCVDPATAKALYRSLWLGLEELSSRRLLGEIGPIERLGNIKFIQLVTNPLGVFVNVVSDALNGQRHMRAAEWALLRMGKSPLWRLRTEAAWVISEQLRPTEAHIQMLWTLLLDTHPRVVSSATQGVIEHASFFSRQQLEAGLQILRAAPTDRWAYLGSNESAKRRMISELQSALNDTR